MLSSLTLAYHRPQQPCLPSPVLSPKRDHFNAGPLPRQWTLPRARAPIVALFMLTALSLYAIAFHLNDPVRQVLTTSSVLQQTYRAPHMLAAHRFGVPVSTAWRPAQPALALEPSEELAALVAFTASTGNALPLSVNPALALDPDLVVEFDTRTEDSPAELRQLVDDTWQRYPVVAFEKAKSQASRELRAIISSYNLDPPPLTLAVDVRDDAPVFLPVLKRLTSSETLPILLVGGRPVGTLEQIRSLHESGELRSWISQTSAQIDGAKPQKKPKH